MDRRKSSSTRARAVALSIVAVAATLPRTAPAGTPAAAPGPVHRVAAARAATTTIVIARNAMLRGFGAADYRLAHGGSLTVVNHDSVTHTVTSVARTAAGTALFDTTVTAGATASVAGASTLASGRFAFYCRLHPSMRATLVVGGSGGGATGETVQFRQRLTFPRVISASRATLVVRQTRQRVLPSGPRTLLRTYGGSYPGPTIRRPAGRGTTIRVVNRLPRRDGAISMHLHGDHHSARSDGQPTRYLVRPGRARTYRYPLRSDGRAVPPSFGFYHDHVMGVTGRNNWDGEQGMVIVDDGREKSLGLPTGHYDRPLLISDRSFGRDNSLVPARTATHGMTMTGPDAPPNDETVGDRVLVNGRYAPYFAVRTHRYRLRLLNGSNFQSYDLALSDGRSFVQLGSGSSLFPHSVRRSHILLGPAQRADVIVDFRREYGKRIVLRSVARRHRPRGGIGTPRVAIMQFRVTRHAADRLQPHHRLEPTPRIVVPRRSTMTWNFGLGHTAAGATYWTVNGRPYDPRRIDTRVPLGATRRWTLRNTSTVTHYIHLHEEQWHTILRDGRAPPAYERGLQDTWRLDPGETVVVAAKFTDYTGVFMIHCHMLDHEDDGMMAQFQVVGRPHARATAPAGFFFAGTTRTLASDAAPMHAMPGMGPADDHPAGHGHDGDVSGPVGSRTVLGDAALAAGLLATLFMITCGAMRYRRTRRA